MSWNEFYQLALENYEHGGDGVVECWDENTFAEYEREFGAMTYERAMKMFNTCEEVYRDILGTIF